MDCNGYSTKYKALNPGMKMHCTDPLRTHTVKYDGKNVIRGYRFQDNGHYIGHDEPSTKFISHAAGSGNTMTYIAKLAEGSEEAAHRQRQRDQVRRAERRPVVRAADVRPEVLSAESLQAGQRQ